MRHLLPQGAGQRSGHFLQRVLPKSPSVERFARLFARVSLSFEAGNWRICSASCLLTPPRFASGTSRRCLICSAMGCGWREQ